MEVVQVQASALEPHLDLHGCLKLNPLRRGAELQQVQPSDGLKETHKHVPGSPRRRQTLQAKQKMVSGLLVRLSLMLLLRHGGSLVTWRLRLA